MPTETAAAKQERIIDERIDAKVEELRSVAVDFATEPQTIHQLMARVLNDLPAIGKNQRNTQQNFNFRGIDDVLNALNPLLSKYGVYFVPDVLERVSERRTTSGGSTMYEVNLHVRFTFFGPLGDSVAGSAWGEGTDMGDKATNKAMTQAMKAMLFQAFAVNTAETAADDSDRDATVETRPRTADDDATDQGYESAAERSMLKEELVALTKEHVEAGELTDPQRKELKALFNGIVKEKYEPYKLRLAEMAAETKQAKAAAAIAEQDAAAEGSE